MDDLQTIEPSGTLEILGWSERRKIYRDGPQKLVPVDEGILELHVRKPGGDPFTVYVSESVMERFELLGPPYDGNPEDPASDPTPEKE